MEELVNYGPWAKLGLQSISVNKDIFIGIQSHLFIYCLWLLLYYNSQTKLLWQGLYDAQSLKYLVPGSLQKMFADLGYRIKKKTNLSQTQGYEWLSQTQGWVKEAR